MSSNEHYSEELLEQYSLGNLSEAEVEPLEDHVYSCDACQQNLALVDRYIQAMKSASLRLRREESTKTVGAFQGFFNNFRMPAMGLITAAAAACLVLAVSVGRLRHSNADMSPIDVELSAVRGETASIAPANHRYKLVLDTRGIDVASGAHADLVDADGDALEQDPVAPVHGQATVQTRQTLSAGRVYVRLFPAGATGYAREYLLILK